MKDLVLLRDLHAMGPNPCNVLEVELSGGDNATPSGQDVVVRAVSSTSMLVIFVGLTRSRTSKPRSIPSRENALEAGPLVCDV